MLVTKPDEFIIAKLEAVFNRLPISPYAVARFLFTVIGLFYFVGFLAGFLLFFTQEQKTKHLEFMFLCLLSSLAEIYLYKRSIKNERQNKCNKINEFKEPPVSIARYYLIYTVLHSLYLLSPAFIAIQSALTFGVYLISLNWIQPNAKAKSFKLFSLFART